MPYPRWLAKVNRRLFNPKAVTAGRYPVVTHVGRISGKTYHTPLDAFATETGFVMVVRYGPGSDWVRNILKAGSASLRIDGADHPLESPRLVSQDEALDALIADTPPKHFTKAEDFLLMDRRLELDSSQGPGRR